MIFQLVISKFSETSFTQKVWCKTVVLQSKYRWFRSIFLILLSHTLLCVWFTVLLLFFLLHWYSVTCENSLWFSWFFCWKFVSCDALNITIWLQFKNGKIYFSKFSILLLSFCFDVIQVSHFYFKFNYSNASHNNTVLKM